MFVTVVAAIALVMTNNIPSPTPTSPTLFARCMGAFVSVLQQAVLPHLVAGFGIFVVSSYAAYLHFLSPLHLPEIFLWVALAVLIGCYGFLSFGYALLTASLFALRLACVAWDDFIDETLDKVKEKMVARLDGVQEGLAKDQAKVLVRGSVREVLQVEKRESMPLPKWIVAVFLGVLTLALRSVLVARIVKASGTTIRLSKIFAGKATLVGAVFLNLRFFSTALLGLAYLVGGAFLILNVVWVCW